MVVRALSEQVECIPPPPHSTFSLNIRGVLCEHLSLLIIHMTTHQDAGSDSGQCFRGRQCTVKATTKASCLQPRGLGQALTEEGQFLSTHKVQPCADDSTIPRKLTLDTEAWLNGSGHPLEL